MENIKCNPVSPPTSPYKACPEQSRKLIVLDWDDTLLPTTQLTDNYGDYITGSAPLPAHVVAALTRLEDIAVAFLDKVAACGDATIITNAMSGWVDLSGKLFIPRVLEALNHHDISIVYARDQHGSTGEAEDWKIHAFCNLVSDNPPRTHIVSIGDSVFERDAAHFAAKKSSAVSVTTVKLIDPWEGPTVKQVQAQLQVLTEVIQDFVTNGESTDMHLDFSGDTTTIVQHKELMSLDSGNLC